MTLSNENERCTCGGEDSDGRTDVLRCTVHGIGVREVTFTVHGDVPWEQMSPETQEAIRAIAQAAYEHLGKTTALPGERWGLVIEEPGTGSQCVPDFSKKVL